MFLQYRHFYWLCAVGTGTPYCTLYVNKSVFLQPACAELDTAGRVDAQQHEAEAQGSQLVQAQGGLPAESGHSVAQVIRILLGTGTGIYFSML